MGDGVIVPHSILAPSLPLLFHYCLNVWFYGDDGFWIGVLGVFGIRLRWWSLIRFPAILVWVAFIFSVQWSSDLGLAFWDWSLVGLGTLRFGRRVV